MKNLPHFIFGIFGKFALSFHLLIFLILSRLLVCVFCFLFSSPEFWVYLLYRKCLCSFPLLSTTVRISRILFCFLLFCLKFTCIDSVIALVSSWLGCSIFMVMEWYYFCSFSYFLLSLFCFSSLLGLIQDNFQKDCEEKIYWTVLRNSICHDLIELLALHMVGFPLYELFFWVL